MRKGGVLLAPSISVKKRASSLPADGDETVTV